MEILDEVRRSDHDHLQIGMRAGDRVESQKREWCLRHRPHGQTAGSSRFLQRLDEAEHIVGRLHLGHQHGVGAGRGDRREIVRTPRRSQGIDAHDQLPMPVSALAQRCDDLLPCKRLGVGCYRILEIQDQCVGGQGARFLERAGVGAWHVQHRAAWADRLGHGDRFISRVMLFAVLAF